MTVTGTHVRSSWRGVAWGAFFASWGGWLLDGFTASVYAFVALPATQYLLPASHIPLKYESFFLAAFFSVFLIGWGTAFIFGPLGDRYGRFRVLAISIALYGVGSVLSGLSTNAYEFMAFRFITGLGIGAEWFVGGTSVAEIFPEDRRVFGAGLFHSGYYFGYFFAALAALFLQSIIGFRGMLILGVIPVAFIMYIRYTTKEPERWERARERMGGNISSWKAFRSIFSREYLRVTVVSSVVMVAVILGLWSGTVYVPTAIEKMAAIDGIAKTQFLRLSALGGAVTSTLTIVGCILMPLMAERVGRRITLIVFLACMAVSVYVIYGIVYYLHSLTDMFALLVLLGFGGADFSVFSLWLPELYPTEARSSGFGAVTTLGRYFAAGFEFLIGIITLAVGFGHGIAYTAIAFVAVMPLVFLIRETRGKGLREEVLRG